jgi:hypothetical protein
MTAPGAERPFGEMDQFGVNVPVGANLDPTRNGRIYRTLLSVCARSA